MKASLQIEISLPDNCDYKLLSFSPVEGKWSISAASYQHMIAAFAAEEASIATGGRLTQVPAEYFKVELFRDDGRSLDGSDGITSGNLLITRRA
jgi:hypothetical protein